MMPSLLRYFTIVGAVLIAGLIGVNALLDQGGPGLTSVRAEAPKTAAIRFDPRASKVERLRAEEAAQRAAASATPAAPVIAASQVAPETVTSAAQPAPPAPVTAAVQPSLPAHTVAPVALTTAPDEAEVARAVRAAQEKMKAEKARKQRIARERARERAMREASLQPVPQPPQQYGYAPRPTFGPFGQGGGWGGGGWGQRW